MLSGKIVTFSKFSNFVQKVLHIAPNWTFMTWEFKMMIVTFGNILSLSFVLLIVRKIIKILTIIFKKIIINFVYDQNLCSFSINFIKSIINILTNI